MRDEWPVREGHVRERHGDLRDISAILSKSTELPHYVCDVSREILIDGRVCISLLLVWGGRSRQVFWDYERFVDFCW